MNAQIDPIAVYALAKTEGVPVVKLGGCTRVLVDDLKAWVREQEQ